MVVKLTNVNSRAINSNIILMSAGSEIWLFDKGKIKTIGKSVRK